MRPGDVPVSFSDIDNSIEILDYKPITNVGVGIKKFVEFYVNYNKDE